MNGAFHRIVSTLMAFTALTVLLMPQSSASGKQFSMLVASPGDLEIRNLGIEPQTPRVGEPVSIYFELVNNTDQDITIGRMGIGLRGPDACAYENPWNAPIPFDPGGWDNQVVPAHSWTAFAKWLNATFSQPGVYIIEPVYDAGGGQYPPFQKSTPIWPDVLNTDGGIVTPNCLVMEQALEISPLPVQQGNIVWAAFRIRNRSPRTITLQRLLAAGRWSTDPSSLNWGSPNNADFPDASEGQITLASNQAYDYVTDKAFYDQGYYFAEPWRQEAGEAGRYHTGGIWGGNRVKYVVGEIAVSGVPLYYQGNNLTPISLLPSKPSWASEAYGRYPVTDTVNTIGQWGCNLSSGAMIISYHRQAYDPRPDTLNTWLRSSDFQGYDSDNGVVYSEVVRYACRNSGQLVFDDVLGRNDPKLDEYLRAGNPVMLAVNNGGHYVVATGKLTVAEQSTYMINDPIYGRTTLRERYSDRYSGLYLYRRAPCDPRMLEWRAHSPVHLVVTDPLGRRSGYDPRTGSTWDEIPDAGYFSEAIVAPDGSALPESKVLHISSPVNGQYNLQVIGYDSGAYQVEVYRTESIDSTSRESFAGTAQSGSVDNYMTQFTSSSKTFLPVVIANPQPSGPSIRVDPPSGTSGVRFNIYGSRFTPGESVQLWLLTPSGDRMDDPTPHTVDSQGNFTSWVQIGFGPAGTYTLYARGNQSQQTASANFQITSQSSMSARGGLQLFYDPSKRSINWD